MSSELRQFFDKRPNTLFIKHILRKVFLEDWVMKLVALFITFALWLGVTGLSTPTTTRMTGVPLTLRFSNDTEITNSPIQEVDIVISGDRRRVSQINKNDLVVSVDLTDVLPGDRVINLAPENVSLTLPTGVKLDEVQPSKIAVRLETVEEKEVAVNVETDGVVPEGFEVYSQTVIPQRVGVRGPSSFIRQLTAVSTEKIDLTNRDTDFTVRQIPLRLSNPNATPRETAVDVTFRIGEKRIERVYSVPLRDEPTKRANVVLFGGRSLIEGIRAEDLSVETVRNEAGEETPRLTLPPSLEGRVEIRRVRVN